MAQGFFGPSQFTPHHSAQRRRHTVSLFHRFTPQRSDLLIAFSDTPAPRGRSNYLTLNTEDFKPERSDQTSAQHSPAPFSPQDVVTNGRVGFPLTSGIHMPTMVLSGDLWAKPELTQAPARSKTGHPGLVFLMNRQIPRVYI